MPHMPLESLSEVFTEQGVYQGISWAIADEKQDADFKEQQQVLKLWCVVENVHYTEHVVRQ